MALAANPGSHRVLAVLISLAAACCRPDAPPPERAATADTTTSPQTSAHHGVPFTMRADGPREVSAGDTITITVLIERAVANEAPIKLDVALPPGASLVSGSLSEELVDGNSTSLKRTLRVKFDEIPPNDIVVTAGMRANGHGAHARSMYRFGREEPRPPTPQRAEPIVVNGRNLGSPVQLSR